MTATNGFSFSWDGWSDFHAFTWIEVGIMTWADGGFFKIVSESGEGARAFEVGRNNVAAAGRGAVVQIARLNTDEGGWTEVGDEEATRGGTFLSMLRVVTVDALVLAGIVVMKKGIQGRIGQQFLKYPVLRRWHHQERCRCELGGFSHRCCCFLLPQLHEVP